LDLHLRLSSNTNAGLKNNLCKQTAEGKTGIALIAGLQNNAKNMLAQAERQAKMDGIDKLGFFQNQVTAPDNWP
jgi:hypothetical protein